MIRHYELVFKSDPLHTLSKRLRLAVSAPLLLASMGLVAPAEVNAQRKDVIKSAPASPEEMILYVSTFAGDACAALSSGADFEKAIIPPTRNLALIFEVLHGGKIPGAEGKKPTRKQLIVGANNMIARAILSFCPEDVPAEIKTELKKYRTQMKK